MLRDNPALVLTAAYLALTIIGAIYNWQLCRQFGINIMEIADASDFLMFAVRDFAVVAFAALTVGPYVGMYAFFAHLKKAPPRKRNALMRRCEQWAKQVPLRAFALMFVAFGVYIVPKTLSDYARRIAGGIEHGQGPACEYVLSGNPQATPQAAQLVTITTRFVVLRLPEEKTTLVIPRESVNRLVFR